MLEISVHACSQRSGKGCQAHTISSDATEEEEYPRGKVKYLDVSLCDGVMHWAVAACCLCVECKQLGENNYNWF
jgi:hypothetical protein